MTGDVRILLVDDHTLVRESLCERLSKEPGLAVVGGTCTADEAIEKVTKCAPDVILMDIDMPGLICFDAVQKIAAIRPNTRIVFLSAFVEDHFIEQALKVKARGYLTKSETPETVVAAIREVASGGAYFSEAVRERIVIDSSGARLDEKPKSRASTLTRRELEILRYIAKGLGKKEIAKVAHLSVKTIDHHTTRLMKKLAIHNRVDLARFAIREGIAKA